MTETPPEETKPPPPEEPQPDEEQPSTPPLGPVEVFIVMISLPLLILAVILFGRSARSAPTATTVLFETFDHGVSRAWSRQDVDHARFKPESATNVEEVMPRSKRVFLGQFGAETVVLTLNDLPSHASVEVAFDLFTIRSWDGNNPETGPDQFQVYFDDEPSPVFSASFTNSAPSPTARQSYPYQYGERDCPGTTGAAETGTLGFDFRETPRNSVYRISTTSAHEASSLRIHFTGFGLSSPIEDESWGLDNVSVTVSSQLEPNPEPEWAANCREVT